ncbi:hypothetical protein [Vulgatibacter incomptus]|nr:hypothetical protein [Vulgatibacter incomptus]
MPPVAPVTTFWYSSLLPLGHTITSRWIDMLPKGTATAVLVTKL